MGNKDATGEDHSSTHLSHSDYSEVFNMWHSRLGAALLGCLKSKEFMINRTSLVVLMRMVSSFPTQTKLGEKLFCTIDALQKDSQMKDIQAMATSYSSALTAARNND